MVKFGLEMYERERESKLAFVPQLGVDLVWCNLLGVGVSPVPVSFERGTLTSVFQD